MVGVRSAFPAKSLDVGQRRIFKLYQEFLAVVGRDQIDCESHALGFAAVHANTELKSSLVARGMAWSALRAHDLPRSLTQQLIYAPPTSAERPVLRSALRFGKRE
jgi:hypothetical protein